MHVATRSAGLTAVGELGTLVFGHLHADVGWARRTRSRHRRSDPAAWSAGGVRAADEAMIEHVSVLLATDDVQRGVAAAIPALEAGTPRAPMNFNGQ